MEDGRLRFLSSLGTRGVRTPFSFFLFLVLLAQKNLFAIFFSITFLVLLAQVSSAAILFAENRYTKQFFFHRKKILTKKNCLRIFFPEVEKSCAEISREQKLRISAKMRKMEAYILNTELYPERGCVLDLSWCKSLCRSPSTLTLPDS